MTSSDRTRSRRTSRCFVQAALQRKEPLDHVLFCGPPGSRQDHPGEHPGRRTEREPRARFRSRPSSTRDNLPRSSPSSTSATCSSSTRSIARHPWWRKTLYTAIEDFRIEVVTGDGPYAQTLQLSHWPLHARGGDHAYWLAHGPAALPLRLRGEARLLPAGAPGAGGRRAAQACSEIPIDEGAAVRARTPGARHTAHRQPLAARARDFAEVLGDGTLSERVAEQARSTGRGSRRPRRDGPPLPDRHHRLLQRRSRRHRDAGSGAERAARHPGRRVRALS